LGLWRLGRQLPSSRSRWRSNSCSSIHVLNKTDDHLKLITHCAERMARGGMYDVVGGGFSRYSVDNFWRVPHFEKMLYDNAQLMRAYLHAWQLRPNLFSGRSSWKPAISSRVK
jgi:uncharacterized protein YyaL (SSP411 family)